MGKLDTKVAIISGAARGQGEAEARLFAAEGARVVVADLLADLAAEVAASIGEAAISVPLDVRDPESWAQVMEVTRSTWGRLDILVNNAGIMFAGSIDDTTVDDYLRVVHVNQLGCWLGMKYAIPVMRESGGGSIVNVSSTAGLVGSPNASAYVASKFAIRGMTKAIAGEVGHDGIRVNSVHPGPIATDMLASSKLPPEERNALYADRPIPRVGEISEIAKLVLFVASDDASFSTGAEFVADGGGLASTPVPQLGGR